MERSRAAGQLAGDGESGGDRRLCHEEGEKHSCVSECLHRVVWLRRRDSIYGGGNGCVTRALVTRDSKANELLRNQFRTCFCIKAPYNPFSHSQKMPAHSRMRNDLFYNFLTEKAIKKGSWRFRWNAPVPKTSFLIGLTCYDLSLKCYDFCYDLELKNRAALPALLRRYDLQGGSPRPTDRITRSPKKANTMIKSNRPSSKQTEAVRANIHLS